MKRETVEKANEIIRKIDKNEAALKILETPKDRLHFYIKDYYNPEFPHMRYDGIPFEFEESELQILIERKKKEIERLKDELEKL